MIIFLGLPFIYQPCIFYSLLGFLVTSLLVLVVSLLWLTFIFQLFFTFLIISLFMFSSEFNSVSLMGVSNPEMFLSEKDLNSMEFNILVTPTLKFEDDHECQIAPFEDIELIKEQEELQKQKQKQQEEEKEDKCKILVSSLKQKLPSKEEFKIEDDSDDDGFKTPTSLDKKIPVILKCPPAPRKPKSLPSTKRKAPQRRRILLDLSNEIDSLFPPALLADLGGKIKKVRQGNDTK